MKARGALAFDLGAAALIAALTASAAPGAPGAVGAAPSVIIGEAQRLERAGKVGEAIELLKSARERFPASEPLVVALGAVYLADHNPFWALNVLTEYTAAHTPACQARAWAAWAQIGQANLEEAQALLDAPDCSVPPELKVRFLLLRALVAHHQSRAPEVVRLLQEARAVGRLYAEDHELLEGLSARYEPGRLPLADWSVEAAAGFTSNGLSGAPVDEQTRASSDSMVGVLGAHVRSLIPSRGAIRPLLELQVRAQQLTSEAARDYTYRQLSLRPGVLLGRTLPRLELRYAAEAVQLQGGDRYGSGPMWYSEAHRGEYELETTASFSVFGGAGYRWIRDRTRTRFELDQGAAWVTPIGSRTELISGGSARWYSARASAYTEIGATALAQADVRLLDQLSLRANLSWSGDIFPHSEGYFPSAGSRERRELLLRAGAGLWWPRGNPLRAGVEYTYARRDSTATDYGYVDHRALLRFQWTDDTDRTRRTLVPREGRVSLETGFASSTSHGPGGASVRELLRQDEAAQRGSSCLK